MTHPDDIIAAPQRLRVRQLAACGVPPETIRLLAAPHLETRQFLEACAGELTFGAAEADRAVATTLYELASTGKSIQATLAWARQRLGWSGDNEAILHDTSTDSTDGFAGLQKLMDELAACKATGTTGAEPLDRSGPPQSAAAAG